MGLLQWFAYRSPRKQKRDYRKYDAWAFPYGDTQQAIIQELLKGLFPKEAPRIAMARYLIGREGYVGDFEEEAEDREGITQETCRLQAGLRLRNQMNGVAGEELGRYLALIEADAQIGEDLNYPSLDQLRQNGTELAAWFQENRKKLQ